MIRQILIGMNQQVVPSETLLPALQMVIFSLCPHMVVLLCMSVS